MRCPRRLCRGPLQLRQLHNRPLSPRNQSPRQLPKRTYPNNHPRPFSWVPVRRPVRHRHQRTCGLPRQISRRSPQLPLAPFPARAIAMCASSDRSRRAIGLLSLFRLLATPSRILCQLACLTISITRLMCPSAGVEIARMIFSARSQSFAALLKWPLRVAMVIFPAGSFGSALDQRNASAVATELVHGAL
jgi:hypothetical protein